MGLQINSQPQNFKSNVVIGDGLSAVDGVTVYGSLSASGNLQASSVSAGNVTALAGGKFYGDGSGLTNINAGNLEGFSGVTSVNTLTGAVTNVVFTGSANNFSGVNTFSQTTNFQSVTGTTATFNNFVSGSSNLNVLFGDKTKTDSVFSTVQGITGTGLNTTNLTGVNVRATSLTATNYYNSTGTDLSAVYGSKANTDSVVSTVQGITGTGLNTTNLTGVNVRATSLTATNYFDGTGNNLNTVYGSKANTDSVFNTVQSYSANDWTAGKTLSSSGGTLGGNVRVGGNLIVNYLSALSGATFVNTTFTTTSSLCVVGNLNSGAALYVGANGTGDIASFYDIDQNVEVLHVGGVNSSFPNVGIKVSNPTETLTVSGTISSSGVAYFDNVFSKGTNLTSLLNSNTGNWNSAYTSVTGNSANWANTFTAVNSNSSNWTTAFTVATANSGNWNSAYTSVTGNSGNWNSTFTAVTGNSGNWNSTFTAVTGTSARWNTAYNLLTGGGTLSGTGLTIQGSVSSPSVSAGTYYGSGANLTGVVYSVNGSSGAVTNILTTSGGTITGSNVLNSPILSSQTVSANTLVVSSYPIAPVTVFNTIGSLPYTIVSTDNNLTLTYNSATSGVINVPTGLPVGFQCNIIQLGTGRIRLSAASGVTLNNDLGYTITYKQYSGATVLQYAASTFVLYGSLSS